MDTNDGILRVVGKKKRYTLGCCPPSGEVLKAISKSYDSLQALWPKSVRHHPRGVWRFKTHEEANAHEETYVAERMLQVSMLEGRGGK